MSLNAYKMKADPEAHAGDVWEEVLSKHKNLKHPNIKIKNQRKNVYK